MVVSFSEVRYVLRPELYVVSTLRILQPFQESQPSRWAIICPANQQLTAFVVQRFVQMTTQKFVKSRIQQTYNKMPRNVAPVEYTVHETERKLISLVL